MQRFFFFSLITLASILSAATQLVPWGAIFLVLVCIFLGSRGHFVRSPKFQKTATVIGISLFIIANDLIFGGGQSVVLRFSADLLIFLLCFRALSHEHLGARMQVGVLSLLPLAVAAFRFQIVIFLPCFFVFSALYLAFLVEQASEAPSSGKSFSSKNASRLSQVPSVLRLFALCCAFGMILFALLPRLGYDLASPAGTQQQRSGYSDASMDLQKSGQVDLDPQLIFSAQIQPREEGFYWRLQTQSRFDGNRWSSDAFEKASKTEKVIDALGAFFTRNKTRENAQLEFTRPWRFYRIPSLQGTIELNAVDEKGEVFPIFSRDIAQIWYRNRWKRGEEIMKLALDIQADSPINDTPKVSSYELWPYSAKKEKEIFELSQSIIGKETDPLKKAERVEAYLKENYRYSLALPERRTWPVKDFLFEQKYGHCEIFSTAMLVLLNISNVRSRLVTGYYSAEYRNGRNYVRSSHAHAWVEVYDEKGLWIRFDPTPGNEAFAKPSTFVLINDWFANYRNHILFQSIQKNKLQSLGLALLLLSIAVFPLFLRENRKQQLTKLLVLGLLPLCTLIIISFHYSSALFFLLALTFILPYIFFYFQKIRSPLLQNSYIQDLYSDFNHSFSHSQSTQIYMNAGIEKQMHFAKKESLNEITDFLNAYARRRFYAKRPNLDEKSLKKLKNLAKRRLRTYQSKK